MEESVDEFESKLRRRETLRSFAYPVGFSVSSTRSTALQVVARHRVGTRAPRLVVLWFPDQQILFGGCLIKSASADSLGFTGDANLASWPEAVRRVAVRYHPTLIVPGHGPVVLGEGPLRHTLDLLTAPPLR